MCANERQTDTNNNNIGDGLLVTGLYYKQSPQLAKRAGSSSAITWDSERQLVTVNVTMFPRFSPSGISIPYSSDPVREVISKKRVIRARDYEELAEFHRRFPHADFWIDTLPPPDFALYYRPWDPNPPPPQYTALVIPPHTAAQQLTGPAISPPPYHPWPSVTKKMFPKKGTLQQLPNLLQFDHRPKRRRMPLTPSTSQAASVAPPIHLHLANLPLGDHTGLQRARANTLPLESPNVLIQHEGSGGEPLIEYPTIDSVLKDLNGVMPDASLMRFVAAFGGHGIYYADAAQNSSHEFLANVIGMPVGVIRRFQKYVALVVTRAEKDKGCTKTPVVVGAASDKENKP
ncbi:hypothetical protein BV22DRAFT_1052479 [Leucogyrophana mollusca]|uniref:Uncharacterized protein n=1 Tax=Leucogyrophana mollusca TaxID=85980 RepID=A0ACB8AWY3_9AGAM|nr:hypothetical protein BV22DRAFT_1052479 [Leucogyrophana mollusca]